MNGFPELTLNTSFCSLRINSPGHDDLTSYVHLEIFGVVLFQWSKKRLFKGSVDTITETWRSSISLLGFSFNRDTVAEKISHSFISLHLEMLSLVGICFLYSAGMLQFLSALLPVSAELARMPLRQLPVVLAFVSFLVRLGRAILSSLHIFCISLYGKQEPLTLNYVKKLLKMMFKPFLALEILTAIIVIPVVLHTPYGFWAAMTSLMICSIFKVVVEGNAIFGLKVVPNLLGVKVFGFIHDRLGGPKFSFAQLNALIEANVGAPVELVIAKEACQSYSLATQLGSEVVKPIKSDVPSGAFQ